MKDKFALTRGWIAKAQSDLSSTKKLVNSDGPYDTSCFHAQQTIEKLLKAVLAFHSKPIPKTHDLEELQRICLEFVTIPSLGELDFTEITDYAVGIRYDLDFWPEQELALESIAYAEKVLKIIKQILPKQCHA